MSQKPLVIYHKGCADGIGAAWCFWKQYGDTMEYHPGVYNVAPPDVTGRDVYLVDFSYKRETVEQMCFFANKVVLLDHHQSALEDLWDIISRCPNFDMTHSTLNNSGVMIAWNYVKDTTKHSRKMPALLPHIEDRDLWKFKLPNTKEIMDTVFSHPLEIEVYDKLFDLPKNSLKGLVKEGKILRRKFVLDVLSIAKQCSRPMTIGLFKDIPTANANGMYASELGNYMAQNQPFSATYYDTANFRNFSLRSIPGGEDVSVIAATYGGGGHKHAAGFKVRRDHPLACA